MIFSFQGFRYLKGFFIALALVGSGHNVQGSDLEGDGTDIIEIEGSSSNRDTSQKYDPSSLPSEILQGILLNLNPTSLSAVAQTSKRFASLVKDDCFQRIYASLSAQEHTKIMQVIIPDIFGEIYGEQVKTLLKGRPQHVYGFFFRALLSKKNVALLKGHDSALAMEISRQFLKINDTGMMLPNHRAQFFEIASKAPIFFTENMTGLDRAKIIKALASLSVAEIKARVQG